MTRTLALINKRFGNHYTINTKVVPTMIQIALACIE